jgi:hypothetical protein
MRGMDIVNLIRLAMVMTMVRRPPERALLG